jgi:hypothetical protein
MNITCIAITTYKDNYYLYNIYVCYMHYIIHIIHINKLIHSFTRNYYELMHKDLSNYTWGIVYMLDRYTMTPTWTYTRLVNGIWFIFKIRDA